MTKKSQHPLIQNAFRNAISVAVFLLPFSLPVIGFTAGMPTPPPSVGTGEAVTQQNTTGIGTTVAKEIDHVEVCPPSNPGCGITKSSGAPIIPPLKGWVDLHTHPLSNLAFGGKFVAGGVDVGSLLPADSNCNHNVRATSIQQALGPDMGIHGGYGYFDLTCGDFFRNQFLHTFLSLNGADDWSDGLMHTSGYPGFSTWPTWSDLINQKMWVDWIKRSYDGGLRVMVALAVNNKLLADLTRGPGDILANDDKGSADMQINEIKAFVGRHSDFMQIAYNSQELYDIVLKNKLAVVVGVEIDQIGNLPLDASAAALNAEVDRLYGLGVRYIFPVHLMDNAIGGAAAYNDLFNVGNVYETGKGYDLGCAASNEKVTYSYKQPDIGLLGRLGIFSKLGFNEPNLPSGITCPPGVGTINKRGLTPAGKEAILAMMKKGMLIDIDHMSDATANATIALAQAQKGGYPLNSGHNGVRGASEVPGDVSERLMTIEQYDQIGKLHGMAGVGSAKLTADKWLSLYKKVVTAMGTEVVAGFGTDMNGLEFAMPPRKNSAIKYNTPSFPMKMSSTGNKTWDYNKVGVAHYGMLPDFMEDVASLTADGGAQIIAGMKNKGAQYFYDTWRIAEEVGKNQ